MDTDRDADIDADMDARAAVLARRIARLVQEKSEKLETSTRAEASATPDSRAGRAVVIIDGRSGAGKTELARRVARLLGAEVVHLDDFYPGWSGLAAATAMVPDVLTGAGYTAWNWEHDCMGNDMQIGEGPLVVEGCGALSQAAVDAAPGAVTVWMDENAALRRFRALRRDPGFAPLWRMWAEQEDAHIVRERPHLLADVAIESGQWRVR